MARLHIASTVVLLLAIVLNVGGCSSAVQLTPQEIAANTPLARIDEAFRRTVKEAYADPEQDWHSGWFGNTVVNLWGGDNRGLCWQWQQRVYAGVRPTVAAVGWHATGVQINRGRPGEHHAVIVFDPARVAHDNLLTQPPPRHGWVLDAWNSGNPEVYTLDEWRNVALRITVEWELQDLSEIPDLPESEQARSERPSSPTPSAPTSPWTSPTPPTPR